VKKIVFLTVILNIILTPLLQAQILGTAETTKTNWFNITAGGNDKTAMLRLKYGLKKFDTALCPTYLSTDGKITGCYLGMGVQAFKEKELGCYVGWGLKISSIKTDAIQVPLTGLLGGKIIDIKLSKKDRVSLIGSVEIIHLIHLHRLHGTVPALPLGLNINGPWHNTLPLSLRLEHDLKKENFSAGLSFSFNI